MVADVDNCTLLNWSNSDIDGDVVATFTHMDDSSSGGSSIMQLI